MPETMRAKGTHCQASRAEAAPVAAISATTAHREPNRVLVVLRMIRTPRPVYSLGIAIPHKDEKTLFVAPCPFGHDRADRSQACSTICQTSGCWLSRR